MVFLCRVFGQLEKVIVINERVHFCVIFLSIYDHYGLAFVSLGDYCIFCYKFLVYLFNNVFLFCCGLWCLLELINCCRFLVAMYRYVFCIFVSSSFMALCVFVARVVSYDGFSTLCCSP
jgi:hypothetical protein